MTVAHSPSAYSSTPAQWADDWLTPTERKALRAAESSNPPHTRQAPRKPAYVDPRAVPTRSRASRIVQRACQTVAWSLIAGSIVLGTYIACCMAWVLNAR